MSRHGSQHHRTWPWVLLLFLGLITTAGGPGRTLGWAVTIAAAVMILHRRTRVISWAALAAVMIVHLIRRNRAGARAAAAKLAPRRAGSSAPASGRPQPQRTSARRRQNARSLIRLLPGR